MTAKFSIGVLQSFTDLYWYEDSYPVDAPDWRKGHPHVELARQFEAANFDYIFYLDSQGVMRGADGSMEAALKSMPPSHDPMLLLPILAQATSKIGLVATASTTYYPPFLLARAFNTIDNLSGGRAGWNIVTSIATSEAQNFGLDDVMDHDERYARADEFVDLTCRLWEAWEAGAEIRDERTLTYTDAAMVHSIDHAGRYFKSRGPLPASRSPQVIPYLAQAGASPAGREFAAKHAELTFVSSSGLSYEEMRLVRDDLRERTRRHGRNPDDLNVTFGITQRFLPDDFDQNLPVPVSDREYENAEAIMSISLNTDLSKFDRDKPFPADTPPAGIVSFFAAFVKASERGLTMREAVLEQYLGVDPHTPAAQAPGYHGTPEQIAAKVIETMEQVGGDGVMLVGPVGRGPVVEERLGRFAAVLRHAGVVRSNYSDGDTFRDRMRALRR